MNRLLDVVVTLCTLLLGGFFWLYVDSPLGRAAAITNLVLFVIRVIFMLFWGKGKKRDFPAGSKTQQLMQAQWSWAEEWNAHSMRRTKNIAYLTAAGCALFMTAAGWVSGETLQSILTYLMPMGLLFGEVFAVLLWFPQSRISKPKNMIRKYTACFERSLPSPAEREAAAEELLNTGEEWRFKDMGKKDRGSCGIVGERYWIQFDAAGRAVVIDSRQLECIETTQVNWQSKGSTDRRDNMSAVWFRYRSENPKKARRETFLFCTDDGIGYFMVLLRKRVQDGIPIKAAL